MATAALALKHLCQALMSNAPSEGRRGGGGASVNLSDPLKATSTRGRHQRCGANQANVKPFVFGLSLIFPKRRNSRGKNAKSAPLGDGR